MMPATKNAIDAAKDNIVATLSNLKHNYLSQTLAGCKNMLIGFRSYKHPPSICWKE
jgi:hypothetical protein